MFPERDSCAIHSRRCTCNNIYHISADVVFKIKADSFNLQTYNS